MFQKECYFKYYKAQESITFNKRSVITSPVTTTAIPTLQKLFLKQLTTPAITKLVIFLLSVSYWITLNVRWCPYVCTALLFLALLMYYLNR